MSRQNTNYYSGGAPPLTQQHQMPAGHFNQYQMPGQQQQQQQPPPPPPLHQQPHENNWNWSQPPAQQINNSIPVASNVQQMPPPPQQFNASNVFDNTNSDGWGDWGESDWNDNSQNQQQQRNFGVNQFNANNVPPPQPSMYGQATQFQPQPQHPFPSQQKSDHLQYGNQTQPTANIVDSFGNNSNWNWNASENVEPVSAEPVFETVGKDAVLKHSRNTSNASDSTPAVEKSENNLPRPPDNNKNTQLNNPAMSRIIKSDRLLTPQWSTESQMSHTSSDRSIDSDALNSRSTASSDELSHHQPHYGYHETNQQSVSNFGVENENSHYNVPHKENNDARDSVDKLDEVLFALNVDQQSAAESSMNSYQNPSNVIQQTFQQQQQQAAEWNPVQNTPPVNYPKETVSTMQQQQQQAAEWNPVQNTPPVNYPKETVPTMQQQQPIRPLSASSLPPPPAFQENSRITSSPMNQPPIASSPMNLPPPPTMQQMTRKNSSPLNQPQPQPTPPPMNQPNSAFSSEYTGMLPPPPLQQSQQNSLSSLNQMPPPPSSTSSGLENPFKRTGAHVHNKNIFHSDATTTTTSQSVTTMPAQFSQFAPPNEFNQQHPPPDNSEVIDQMPNRNFASHENHELAPHNDRNQYLQTGHLSEEAFVAEESQSMNFEQNDSLPPPGLSRLVLGQPEIENHQVHPPPGLDRMVPGTELTNSTPLNLDRQADGQDTMPHAMAIRPVSVPNYPLQHQQQQPVNNILDRNLYLVPGESDVHAQRVVTGGLERDESRSAQDISVIPLAEEERELVMDGENLEDDNNQLSRDDPIEGANTGDETQTAANVVENEQISPVDTTKKFNSNPSTCNDDSDKERSTYYRSQTRRGDDVATGSRRRRDKNAERYETEDTDFSDRERSRFNREGSARNDRPRRSKEKDEWPKDSKDRYRDDRERNRKDGDRYRGGDKSRQDRYARYETDGSRYETEDSRYERYRRDDREPRDPRDRRDDGDRRHRRGERSDRGDRGDRGDKSSRVERHNESRNNRYKDPSDRRREKPTRSSDSYYDYEDDQYRRTGSRTGGDRERDKDGRYVTPNYYQQGYGYDQYSYYQQQQYYETLRRTNPQAYAEWYKMYYSQMQQAQMSGNTAAAATDGRESVHSGRSSANEKERYSRSSNHQQMYYDPNLYQRQFSQQHSSTMLDNSYVGDRERQAQSLSRQHSLTKSYNVYSESTRLDASESVQQRSTPCKFTVDHSVASLSNGVMVCVKPQFSANDFSKVVKVFSIGVNDATRKLYQLYPGPLIRGITHKKTIIEFCEDQIRLGPSLASVKAKSNSMSSLYSSGQAYKSSYTLMWNLLILLLRQNGMVVGTDISELLLNNKSEFPYETVTKSSMSSLHSRRNSNDSETKNRYNQDGSDESNDVDDSETKKSLSETEITEKFRNYLLYGNVNEALEWATDNNLWGHALFLASKVDRRSHANVMMKFANKLALNDPLQTLYQLMSGRTPSSVTSVQDDKWGDWRPHLAMILANTSQKPELDRKAITTLGDSLYNRGDLFAAQFCYLMAQVGFGKYSNVNQEAGLMLSSSNAIRLILLGSSHRKPFKDFATNDAIMMTEIYEYACALNDDSFSIVDFQPYKFLLATRLIDYGMHVRALMYLEQISYHIQKNVTKYEPDFIGKVYTLADRLKYFDTVFDRNADTFPDDGGEYLNVAASVGDQQWLQTLSQTVNQFGNLAQQPTIPSIPVHDDRSAYPSMEIKTHIDQQFEQINQQFSELNLQYTQNYGFEQQSTVASQPLSMDYNSQPNFGGQSALADNNNYNLYDHGQQHQQQSLDSMGVADNSMMYGNEQSHLEQLQQQQQQYDQVPNDQSDYWNQQSSNEPDPRNVPSHTPSMPSIENIEPEPEIPKPSISMPNSISNKPGFYDDPPPAASSAQNKQPNSSDEARKEQSNANKVQSQSANANSGWFGGIWNKLSLKPKNQMILPDDKNPSIVWDPDKKKWVNTDGEVEEAEQFRPPPKMTDFATNSQPPPLPQNANPTVTPSLSHEQYSNPNPVPTNLPPATTTGFDQTNPVRQMPSTNPSTGGEATKIPNLQSNMFKMQRNRTLKKSYVDVFNPSGAPAKPIDPIMAPSVPMPSMPQSGYFVPGAVPASGEGQSQQLDNSTHFYNPAQHGAAGGFQQ